MSTFGEKKIIHRSKKLRKSQTDNTVNLMQTIHKEKKILKVDTEKYILYSGE